MVLRSKMRSLRTGGTKSGIRELREYRDTLSVGGGRGPVVIVGPVRTGLRAIRGAGDRDKRDVGLDLLVGSPIARWTFLSPKCNQSIKKPENEYFALF